MADELLESIDRSLESKAKKMAGVSLQKARAYLTDDQDDIGMGVVASGKNKDFIDTIKNRKFGIFSVAPDPRDTKIKSDIHKKLTFLNPKPKKEKPVKEKKAPEFDEKIDERVFKPKLSDLTAKQIQKSLHLFRGAPVPNPPPKLKDHRHNDGHRKEEREIRDKKHHHSKYDKEKEHRHKHANSGDSYKNKHREDKHYHRHEDRKKDHDRHHKIEKEKHRKHDDRNTRKHRDYSDEDSEKERYDDFMEVRDLFDLERENLKSYRIGEYEDRLEMERQERRRQRKERKRY